MTALRIIAQLWVKDGAFQAFNQYERAALACAVKHGATIVEIKQNHAADDGTPHEIHVIDFPSQAAFAAYRNDPAIVAMAELRERSIARTDIETVML